ncbi:MAG: site-2 protease family protein [Opitutae bacterium]|nr:site-2 protease family protein [Opitutae bacterium]
MDIDLTTLRDGLLFYIVLVCSLCIHEWAHAWVADKLGDDTPRAQGRVTVNPLPHMDLFGTVIFPLVCIFVLRGGFLFGWGRPVMVNPSNFKHPRRDDVLVTLAGPMSNLGLALLAALLGGVLYKTDPRTAEIFVLVIVLNVTLAVFNLLPLPPLDGGQVLRHAVRMRDETYFAIARWSFLVLLAALWLSPVRAAIMFLMKIVALPFMLLYQALAGI